jgi:hypothetical protein
VLTSGFWLLETGLLCAEVGCPPTKKPATTNAHVSSVATKYSFLLDTIRSFPYLFMTRVGFSTGRH